jgi:hypothetical protein
MAKEWGLIVLEGDEMVRFVHENPSCSYYCGLTAQHILSSSLNVVSIFSNCAIRSSLSLQYLRFIASFNPVSSVYDCHYSTSTIIITQRTP